MIYIVYLLIVIICLAVLLKFLEISSNMKITDMNISFISDIYKICSYEYKTKLTKLVDWHKKYNHPFLVERSEKVDIVSGKKNNTRFAVFIHLGCFVGSDPSKWIEFSNIIGIPKEIEEMCLSSIVRGANDIDIIWGLDPLEKIEKIYLEYPELGRIDSYVISGLDVIDRYEYIKGKTNNPLYSFMYVRLTSDKKKDSYHMVLKDPIKYKNGIGYIISYNPVKKTYTTYYRFD
jgi:hypothetical protein